MKKITSLSLALLLLCLCGCSEENLKSSRFLLDTIVTLDIACDEDTLKEAFSLCEKYEKLLSKTNKESDVSKLNHSNGLVKVSKDTRVITEKAIKYGKISGGAFDITISPVCDLWDFEGTSLPDRKEISEALKNVDYESIEISGDSINLKGKEIDLGGIAKGYIADRLLDFFKEKKISKGIINLGGNIVCFGERDYKIGIAKPFADNEISATVKLKNKSLVTAGIYQRYIKKGDAVYHHILDPETGYGVSSDLASATVIGDSSVDCDALSTICILKGSKEAKKLIENTKNTQGVFISRNGEITYTSGLDYKNNTFTLK